MVSSPSTVFIFLSYLYSKSRSPVKLLSPSPPQGWVFYAHQAVPYQAFPPPSSYWTFLERFQDMGKVGYFSFLLSLGCSPELRRTFQGALFSGTVVSWPLWLIPLLRHLITPFLAIESSHLCAVFLTIFLRPQIWGTAFHFWPASLCLKHLFHCATFYLGSYLSRYNLLQNTSSFLTMSW